MHNSGFSLISLKAAPQAFVALTSLALLLLGLLPTGCLACKGCVSLDEASLAKVLPKFDVTLIKFDIAYPYGEKHDVFVELAESLATESRLIMGMVGVKDYGDKENDALAKSYGLGKDDLPALRLFVREPKQTVVYGKDEKWSLDSLRDLVRDHSDIYVSLPGCIQQLDRLAGDFMSPTAEREAIIASAKNIVHHLKTDAERHSGEIYMKYMAKAMSSSDNAEYLIKERDRVKRLIKEAKLTDKKKADLGQRLNILKSFVARTKDEL